MIAVNLLLLVVALAISDFVYAFVDDTELASIIGISASIPAVSPIAIVSLLCGWGPGPVWRRGLALVLFLVLFVLLLTGVEAASRNLTYDSVVSYGTGLPLQLASQLGYAFSLAIPLTMILVIMAAIGRWRIGETDLGPVRIRILDVMIGTAVLAVLFVANGEIQAAYYRELFGGFDTFGSHEFTARGQQIQTMVIAAFTAPIAAVLIATSAWCARRWYAWILLAVWVMSLIVISYVIDQSGLTNAIGSGLGCLAGCAWIAVNIALIGRGGWPLARRASSVLR